MAAAPALGELGLGIGWRPELALAIDRLPGLGFIELTSENHDPSRPIGEPIQRLIERRVTVVVHGVALSLGGAERPDSDRLSRLSELARRVGAPLITEHIAFVRSDGLEAGHLLPVSHTRESLEVVVENVLIAQAELSVPLGLENIATLFEWPEAEMDEAAFVAEVVERTGAALLLDISNVHANAHNLGLDPLAYLDRLPLHRLAYVHIAGGVELDGLYHDTHAHGVGAGPLALLEELAARARIPGVMVERDDGFPTEEELRLEMDAISAAVDRGAQRRA